MWVRKKRTVQPSIFYTCRSVSVLGALLVVVSYNIDDGPRPRRIGFDQVLYKKYISRNQSTNRTWSVSVLTIQCDKGRPCVYKSYPRLPTECVCLGLRFLFRRESHAGLGRMEYINPRDQGFCICLVLAPPQNYVHIHAHLCLCWNSP